MALRRIEQKNRVLSCSFVADEQKNQTLFTTTFPVTLSNFRWVIQSRVSSAGMRNRYWAVLVVTPDGETTNNIATTDGEPLYSPERNVILIDMRNGHTGTGPVDHVTIPIDGTSQVSVEMKQGDLLVLVIKNADAGDVIDSLRALVMFDVNA